MKKAVLALAAAACLAFVSPAAAFDHFNNFNLSGNASAGAQPNTPLDASNSLEATMGTTLDAHAAATATLSIPGIPYVAKAQPVPAGVGVVKDMHAGVLDSWGTGVGIDPPIAVGETRHLHVAVASYGANPSHMTANAPHPFRASVNENHLVDESNFSNNEGPGPATWNGMKVIMMGEPNGCGKPLAPSTRPLGAGIAPTPAPTPVVPR